MRCNRSKVKRLRLDRKLNYIPGRPVLIEQSDLLAYVEAAKVRAVPIKQQEDTGPTPEKLAEVQARARADWLKRKLKQK